MLIKKVIQTFFTEQIVGYWAGAETGEPAYQHLVCSWSSSRLEMELLYCSTS